MLELNLLKGLNIKLWSQMHLFDVPWITHDGGSIFSLDLHPGGNKLATAGQDPSGAGLLVVWDTEFLSSIDSSADIPSASTPQCNQSPLARVPHTSSINCVRWARHSDGRRLVCAGDDSVICIYDCVGVYSSMGSIDQQPPDPNRPSRSRNVESYRCTYKLFGHSIDVMHIDWSPDGKFLASCSLDNTVIIWNALKLPEKVTVLKQSDGGHGGGVKGLAWDPVGRFLATQSEENTMKIWQTDNWSCVRTFDEPFKESANSTMFCRMDWSPEGSYLVAPCSMNNGGPTAKIFVRKDWSCKRDFVGFRKAVSCLRANPACFQQTNSVGTHSTVSCFAVGSRDRSLSVWLIPNFGRPLLVFEKLFKLSIVDLSWNGLTLAACSVDGGVRLMKFSDGDIGHMLSAHDMGLIIERIYGIRPQFLSPSQSRKSFSSDFGYTSICEALSKRAMESTISPKELHRIAFNLEIPKKKVPMEVMQKYMRKANKMMRSYHIPENKTKTPNKQKNDRKHQLITAQRDDRPLYERAKTEPGDEKDPCVLFELPEQKRLIFAETDDPELESASIYVEVINDCVDLNCKLPVSRITAFRSESDQKEHCWEFFVPRTVSLLVINSQWAVFTTFDAHFFALSTATGRLLFEICLEEPLAILELGQHLCLTIGISGTFSLWNVSNGRIVIRNSLKELLYENPVRQLIATSFHSRPKKSDTGEEPVFVELMFSDLCSFVYSTELQGWVKHKTILDLLDEAHVPSSISSMVLQNPEPTNSTP